MKHSLCIGAMLLLPILSFAQKEKRLHYGISFGLQQSDFEVKNYFKSYYKSVDLNEGTGYRLGLIANYKVTKTISVNLKTEMAFYGCTINTLRVDNATAHFQMAPIAELAADVRYKAPFKVVQPYVYAGASYGKQLSGNGSTNPNDEMLKMNFAAMQLGLGVEKKVRSVIIAPELRYSRSLSDAGRVCNMSGIQMNTVALILNFKGI